MTCILPFYNAKAFLSNFRAELNGVRIIHEKMVLGGGNLWYDGAIFEPRTVGMTLCYPPKAAGGT